MRIHVIPPKEIDDQLRNRWREIQNGNPSLLNPFFSVEFTETAAAVYENVFIAIVENEYGVQAFFPFQKKSTNVGQPVGGVLSDYQGIIASKDFAFDPKALLKGSRLKIWDFDHLLQDQKQFQPYIRTNHESPLINLKDGYQVYFEQRRAAGTKHLVNINRKARKLEREHGDLRLELYSRNLSDFECLKQWKREQYNRTNVEDIMSWKSTNELLERILFLESKSLSGIFSILWCNEDIVAAHFGMHSTEVCHWWFPSYNTKYNSYSPGGILLLKLSEELAEAGVSQIDLGKGKAAYKLAFANESVPIVRGSVTLPSAVGTFRKIRYSLKNIIRKSVVLHPALKVYQIIRNKVV